MPHRVEKTGPELGWDVLESSIAMDGYTLTEIGAICYKLEKAISGSSEYNAVLGHISIRTPETTPSSRSPPKANSWVIESRHIKWSSGSQGTRKLNMMLAWKLLEHTSVTDLCLEYKVYVKKMTKSSDEEEEQVYLGAAMVEAFYVSNLQVPDGVSALEFIVQVSMDGISQKLEDSPSFKMDVQDS
ncbi:unnamed protein product [Cuscuta campestris]|uniref:Cytosolic endo-beta-N-acetylglucosaminidase C-terminal domain-containing protein n=1 Tax=Cuscuta campestris TaxID=132261 RepID=A0A484LVY4_9ASTE|nr:unnamed protein product [Cuscuta campestris]